MEGKMKIYAIYAAMEQEPRCYVEAKDIDDLIKIMNERNRNDEPYGMFPGWSPEEISRKEMSQIMNRFNESDIEMVDKDKRSEFALFARMQFDDAPIIEELQKYRLYKQKYSVNLTEKEKDIRKKRNSKTISINEYDKYQATLSKLINKMNSISKEIHENLFDLACQGKWKEWDKNQPLGTTLYVDDDMLRNTGDKNIDLLWEVLDKIKEVKEKIQDKTH